MSRSSTLFRSGKWRSTARLVGLALVLSVVMAVELAVSNGSLLAFVHGTLPWTSLILIAVMIATSTVAIVIAFSMTLIPDPLRVAAGLASAALALIVGIEASQTLGKLPLLFYFGASLCGEVVFTYAAARIWLGSLKLSGPWSSRPPLVAGAAVALSGGTGFVGQSFLSLDDVALNLALVRDLTLVVMAAIVLIALGLYRPLRLDTKSLAESIRLRLPSAIDSASRQRGFQALCLGMFGSIALQTLARSLNAEALTPLTVISFAWFGIAWQGLGELATLSAEHAHGHVTARLAPNSAHKFLRRHMSDDSQWAATVGIKTSNFVIDHDPESALHSQLPASIMQIRSDEIGRCVVDVLGSMSLHTHSVGHRISGCIDPEASVRPCVDALKLFAALYLDAGPLVERRIKGLTSLLPIIDPGLAKMLSAKDVNALIRRNLWFFHFDFNWIDQHVVHTPKLTRYDVRAAGLSSRIRHAMMDHLERTGGVGNFVWIGPEARERLVQEAPTLSNIIEACPVSGGNTSDQVLMFTLKFEQLIPRLQRYYDLDSMRRALMDFEPSQESARLHALLKLQILKAQTTSEFSEVLSSIASVPWRGFREKDQALQLVLTVHHQVQAKLGSEPLSEAKDAKVRLLHQKLLEAVQAVGYPSQVLHSAQINKIQLRDLPKLLAAASNPQNPRFEEAWLLLATTDFSRYPAEQRAAMHRLLQSMHARAGLATLPLAQVKAVDALAALARALPPGQAGVDELKLVQQSLNSLGQWFSRHQVDADCCCLLLDTKVFMSSQLGLMQLEFDAQVMTDLDQAFGRLISEVGAGHPTIVALMSRWQEYRHKIAEIAA